jgi:hypothetical protein
MGMATVANKKALFVMLVDWIPRFDQFFAKFDWFVVLMSRLLGDYMHISRYGDFCVHDVDNDATDYSTTCACARGEK